MRDGTKGTFDGKLTYSENGTKCVLTGTNTLGGEKVDDTHEVWYRLTK